MAPPSIQNVGMSEKKGIENLVNFMNHLDLSTSKNFKCKSGNAEMCKMKYQINFFLEVLYKSFMVRKLQCLGVYDPSYLIR